VLTLSRTRVMRPQGFCFYNSVAVAAGVVLKAGAAQRVAIL